jgi:hypothetical protein
MKFTYIMGTSFTTLRLFFHKSSSLSTHSPPPHPLVWDAVCPTRNTLCWSVGALHKRCVLARFRPKNGVFGMHPWEDQKDGSWRDFGEAGGRTVSSLVCRLMSGLALSRRRRSWFMSLFGSNVRIRCFNFCNVCTYRGHPEATDKICVCSFRPCRGWSAAERPITNVLFIALKTKDPAPKLTSMASSSYTLFSHLWISTGLEPSAVRNSVVTLCLVRTSTASAILHCYCVERTWLTGAPVILVELDSVAIRWLRQETTRRRI